MDLLPALPAVSDRWYENRSRGLVVLRQPEEVAYRLFFPEPIGRKVLEVCSLVVDPKIARCRVADPFRRWFEGDPRDYYVEEKILFISVAGFDSEEPAPIAFDLWVEKNLRATEALDAALRERLAFYRDEHLPALDLASGVFEKAVKDYRFEGLALGSAEVAAAEFCRRFRGKSWFESLYYPELSALRFFSA